ncbi:MAG: hypothetical protein AAF772_05305 [Acidobacteriota bacterium]
MSFGAGIAVDDLSAALVWALPVVVDRLRTFAPAEILIQDARGDAMRVHIPGVRIVRDAAAAVDAALGKRYACTVDVRGRLHVRVVRPLSVPQQVPAGAVRLTTRRATRPARVRRPGRS